jgi:hypothetical protein
MNIFKKLFGRKKTQEPEFVVEIPEEIVEQSVEEPKDPVIADYERLIFIAETPEERADLEKNLERYKKKRGL